LSIRGWGELKGDKVRNGGTKEEPETPMRTFEYAKPKNKETDKEK